MRAKLGQNFLVDTNIAEIIVDAAAITKDDTVIEVGPGRGILTRLIAPLAKELIAVELDPKLASELQKAFSSKSNVKIINENFLDYPLSPIPYTLKIIANLPYYIATAILQKILPDKNWHNAVVMIQKEAADRILASPGTKQFGYISLFCQYYAEPEEIIKVGPGSFNPPPEVDSTVLRLTNKRPKQPGEMLFSVIKLAFRHRRKTILNSLAHSLEVPKNDILQALNDAKILSTLRPERISMAEYEILTYSLKKYTISNGIDI